MLQFLQIFLTIPQFQDYAIIESIFDMSLMIYEVRTFILSAFHPLYQITLELEDIMIALKR